MQIVRPVSQKLLKYETKTIPAGAAGVRATLDMMRSLVREHKKNMAIRDTTAGLVQSRHQKDFAGEVKLIHAFVRDTIRYIRDVNGVEVLQSPPETLKRGYGDCDDKSTLLATMLESIGHPTRFVAVGKSPNSFSHVYVESRIGPKWIPLETTEPVDVGWQPLNSQSRMVKHN